MFRLNKEDYKKVETLITSHNELSVFAVINGIIPGEVYVNNVDSPTAVLVQTSECNLVAGNTKDADFCFAISSVLDFWDQLTPDTEEWEELIPSIHENKFVKKCKRRLYTLSHEEWNKPEIHLAQGYVLEKVDLTHLKKGYYENADKVLEWVKNWGEEDAFLTYGTGCYIRDKKTIISWSLSDCCWNNEIAIGVHTDIRYRNRGFGKIVAAANIMECFSKGYQRIHWLCVDTNKGSVAIAEKNGFTYKNEFYTFSSYPPVENFTDLSEEEWHIWGEYLEKAAETEKRLSWESLFAYIKSNDVQKTIRLISFIEQNGMNVDFNKTKKFINTLQTYGLCSNFKNQDWYDFIE
ncbi:MAG: GNAT family N-acetyltransferase [Mobilitalea sp.]